MKIKKLLPSFLFLCTIFCTVLPYSGYISDQTTTLTLNGSNTADSTSPYSDHLVWKYKYENGKFYKRLFNATTGEWMLMLSWAVMISLCHADMRLPGYLSWNVSFDGADLSAPSRKELVHTSMLYQHFKRRDDGTGICLFHSAVMPEAFLIPEEICQ